MRTTVDGILATGDVKGHHQFTPVAQHEARIAVADMFGVERRADCALLPTAIHRPGACPVGLTEAEAREQGYEVGTSIHSITNVTRSQYARAPRSVQARLRRLERPRAGRPRREPERERRRAGLALALSREVTLDELAAAHHIYPSWGEGVKAAAEQALRTKHLRATTGAFRS